MPKLEEDWTFRENGGRFYNLDAGVGRTCLNLYFDVMLVQFYLRRLYDHPFGPAGKLFEELKMDGYFGKITEGYIRSFQESSGRYSAPLKQDGMVHPARCEVFLISSYTIHRMQWMYHRLYQTESIYDREPGYSVYSPPALRKHLGPPPIDTHGGGI